MKITEGYYLLSRYKDLEHEGKSFCRVIDLRTSTVRTVTQEEFEASPQKYNEGLHGEYLMPDDYVISRNFAMYIDRKARAVRIWFLGYSYEISYIVHQEYDYHAVYWHLVDDDTQLLIKTFFERNFYIDAKLHQLRVRERYSFSNPHEGVKQSFTSFLSGILLE